MEFIEKKQEDKHLTETKKLMKDQIEELENAIKTAIGEYDPDDTNSKEVTENLVGMFIENKEKLLKFLDRPYFARIDFTEQGKKYSEESEIYIGKMSVSKGNGKQVITDWRAPIASLYYDGRIGEVKYSVEDKEIYGNLSKKRVYDIQSGELKSYIDVDVTADDELLKPYLSESSDNRLKNIIATIQKEQNNIIRTPINRDVIVQGTAGSGKTTVALHRIAYLLYVNSAELKPQNILIIGPNKFFLDYISDVLPDLGINNVPQMTFEDLAKEIVGKGIQNQNDNFDIIINSYKSDDSDIRWKISSFKSSLQYKDMIDKYLIKTCYGFLPNEDLVVGDLVILSKEYIRDKFEEVRSLAKKNSSINDIFKNFLNKVSFLIEKNEIKIESILKQKRKKEIESIDLNLSPEEIKNKRNAIYEKYNELLKSIENGGKILLKNYQHKAGKKDAKKIYIDFIKSLSYDDFQNIDKDVIDGIKNGIQNDGRTMEYEDLAPLMYIQNKIRGTKFTEGIKHIIVDEAQDYSEFQLAVLKDILKNNSITILGDVAQGIHPYRGIRDWNKINKDILDNNGCIFELSKSYRTTMEIMEHGNNVIDKIRDKIDVPLAEPVIRKGIPVILEKKTKDSIFGDIKNRINKLKEEKRKNIAIITKSLEDAYAIQKRLKQEELRIKLIDEKSKKYNGGICIVPSYLAKGLEFDSVIIPNVDDNIFGNNELDAKLLYVSITRAMHTLDMYYTNQRTRLLDSRERKSNNYSNIIDIEGEER